MPRPDSPVGVFDSGVGGLTVVREVFRVLPKQPIVYLGDTARVPYGNKSRQTVIRFSTENVLFLLRHNVRLVIVACHTSSSFALPFLKRHFSLPLLGMIEPGVEAALAATVSGRIGVIGTQATVGSGAYPNEIHRWARAARVTQAACPLFVPLAEEGWLEDRVTVEVARRYLRPVQKARVDTLILGCTHYPLLREVIARVMGPKVKIIDSARQVALKAAVLVKGQGASNGARPRHRFFVTDEPAHFERLSHRFLGRRVGDVSRA